MKIKSMTATFGKLERAHLELNEGLNLLYAPNEGGKSTWAAFWKAMLYGIDTRDRDKKGYLADKNKYQPWSGLPMEGEVVLEWQGIDITLRRRAKGTTPFGSFSAVYTGTEEPVVGLTGENCGQMLTGVSREVFERSAFIGGNGDLSVSSAPDLERRIAALVSSGQEDVSYSQTEGRLKEWLNRRKVNRTTGLIPKLEEELVQVSAAWEECREVDELIAAMEREQDELKQRQEELRGEKEIHQRLAQEELNQRFAQADEEYQSACVQLKRLEDEMAHFGKLPDREALKRAQGELQYQKVLEDEIRQGSEALRYAEEVCEQSRKALDDEFFQGMSAEEVRVRGASETADYQMELQRSEKKKKQVGLWLGAAALCIAVGVGLEFGLVAVEFPFWIFGLSFGVICAICGGISHKKSKEAIQRAEKILSRYKVDAPEKLAELVEDYCLRYDTNQEATKNISMLRAGLSDRRARKENSKADLLAFVHEFAPEVSDMFGCSAALSRGLNLEHDLSLARERVQERLRRRDDLEAQGGQLASNLAYYHIPGRSVEETQTAFAQTVSELERVQQQLNHARGKRDVMGDAAVLRAKREALQTQLERRNLEYQALQTALETLKEANNSMQERFSPELNKLTGNYMSQMTGQRYTSVSLNRAMEASALRETDILPHSALYLSRGTADQLYLALRLAVCRLCLPEKPPILLDDALVSFDDERLGFALELLKDLAKEQQILLFTCQSREKDMLKV